MGSYKKIDLDGTYKFKRIDIELTQGSGFNSLLNYFLTRDYEKNTMRGIVMSELSVIDKEVWGVIKACGEDACDKDQLAEHLKEAAQRSLNKIQGMNSDQLWNCVNDGEKGYIFSSRSRFLFLGKKKKVQEWIKSHEKFASLNKDYEKIISSRNKLAHHQDVSKVNMRELRQQLIKTYDLIVELKNSLRDNKKV